ncbi:HlyIII-domain-containing protein [Dothidotthia symphoricarpi CBS 119687]|uniref:HlyIII-domain-containing protein n=1 Tax=Dothidotthia symphoricarpi CBS 119687 TaxID=1392245 RepID=A0A6A6A8G3_9PLEO|nr:HlyIII-domain-containing protein [Dothidotthia symphoricarpi CBS 119687]KAF2127846.1 HlyIII-domain-containing protein [Dothidotthia symphoricarpi CBS 119687]
MVKVATRSSTSTSTTTTEPPIASFSPISRNANKDPYWPTIANIHHIPEWLKDQDYIVEGHPMPTHSYRRSFRLLRCLHTETINIWTHLVGSAALVMTGIALYDYAISNSLPSDLGDKFAFGISIIAGIACFGISAVFHTFRSHSREVHVFWRKWDVYGICLLSLGGGAAATYYGFACDPTMQMSYWALHASAAVAAAVIVFDTSDDESTISREGVFGYLGLVALLPVLHSIGKLGWDRACIELGAHWYLSEALVMCLGASLFASKLPERLSPGTFDIWGHSHQLHHICAVMASAFHVVGLAASYRYRQEHPGC